MARLGEPLDEEELEIIGRHASCEKPANEESLEVQDNRDRLVQ